MKKANLSLLVSAALVLGACSDLFEPQPQITTIGDQTVISNTSSLSHSATYNKQSGTYTCTHPAPDAAFNQGDSTDFSFALISTGGGDDAGQQDQSSEEVEMAGRTPSVLITRELFYRLCEFSRNHELDKNEAKDLYLKTLSTVKDVWSIEAGKTSIKIGETATTNQTTNVVSSAPVGNLATTSASGSTPTTEASCTAAGKQWDDTDETCT